MKTFLVMLSIACTVFVSEAVACGGSGGNPGQSSGRFARSGSQNQSSQFSPIAQYNMSRQMAAAKTAAYNARMQPIRLARATKVREQRTAAIEARKNARIAEMKSKQNQESAFYASARTWKAARTWKDSSGKFQVRAVLVDTTLSTVKLRKEDGKVIDVAISRLSTPDQTFVSDEISSRIQGDTMLVGI